MGFHNGSKGEENAEEIVKLGLEGKELNQKQRETFLGTNFTDVMRTAAKILDIGYTNEPVAVGGKPTLPAAIPTIITAMIKKAPRFFDSNVGVGISVEVFMYEHSRPKEVNIKTISPGEKLRLTKVKEAFNLRVDRDLQHSRKIVFSSEDMDIISAAENLDPESREIYQRIGLSRLNALSDAVENNDADANAFLKVYNPEGGTFYAKEPAIKLLERGVKVWDWNGGEKCGAFETAEPLPDHKQKLQKLLSDSGDLKRISEKTAVDKKTLERLGRGDIEVRISYKDLKSLQKHFQEQTYQESSMRSQTLLVKERPFVYTISRIFAEGEKQQATEPQVHTLFSGVILPDWQKAYDFWDIHFSNLRTPERRVTLDSLLKSPKY